MIKGTVPFIEHEYCDGCKKFSPEMSTETLYAKDEPYMTAMEIRCKNYEICEKIYEYLRKHGTEREDSHDR